MQLKAGDVVVLKTGGPRMTVERADLTGVDCVWFRLVDFVRDDGVATWDGPHKGTFPIEVLVPVHPEKAQ